MTITKLSNLALRAVFVLMACHVYLEKGAAIDFGVHCQNYDYGNGYRAYHQLGNQIDALGGGRVEVVRDMWHWAQINPQDGVYNWTLTDESVAQAKSKGQALIICLYGSPGWANGGKAETFPATNYWVWKYFLQQVAQRYGTNSNIVAWEIWNEQDSWAFFMDNTTDYATRAVAYGNNVLIPAYDTLKSITPSIPVALGGMAPEWHGAPEHSLYVKYWLTALFQNTDAENHCDYIGFHPYLESNSDIESGFAQLKLVMTQYGVGHKPIICTEFAATTDPGKLVQLCTMIAKEPNIIFPCVHYATAAEGVNYGLFNFDGSWTSRGHAYSMFTGELGYANYVCPAPFVTKKSDTVGYTFVSGPRLIHIIWNPNQTDAATIGYRSYSVSAYSVQMSGSTPIQTVRTIPNNREVTLNISSSPTIFVELSQ